MEKDRNEKLTLGNLCNGAVTELFQYELAKVMANIADPNTEAEKSRSITVKIELKPSASRTGLGVGFSVRSVLQPVRKVTGEAFVVREGQQFVAYPSNPAQLDLQSAADNAEKAKLRPISSAESNG